MGLPEILWNECCRAEIVAHIDPFVPVKTNWLDAGSVP
jgi:hypothetical protein